MMEKIKKILNSRGIKFLNKGIFAQEVIEDLEGSIYEKETKKGKRFYTKCFIRGREIQLKPEEVIRQLFLRKLVWDYGYPKELIKVEYPVHFGREIKKADIVVENPKNPTYAYIIVETKKPTLKEGKEQLKSYTNATGAPIAVWTNGERIEVFHRKDPNYFENIPDLPKYGQSLRELLQEKFTIEDLKRVDKLTNEKISLKEIILDLEDEVLANAGVDVFEEVLKLIFAKLYDELQSFRNPRRPLEFRNYGESDPELKEKIQRLFDEAKRKWEGIFPDDAKIELSPSHLAVCVGSLQDVKIFNTNLDVIDDAFEYLVNKTSKGEKGQYFTPRYVIDMVVKMLNPTENEYIIDPACGSFGFPIHVVFKVWKDIYEKNGLDSKDLLTAEEKIPEAIDYVREKVFGIDFDEKVVRVAKLLNLIAGDGHSNVIRLNSLDYEQWKEWIDDEDWRDKYYEGWKKLKKLLKDKRFYRDFNFDIVMTNPPFAGDIKESRIIHKYELAQKFNKKCEPTGKYPKKISRDILFIERALQFLKPGGRLAIVLPQGRLNNASDRCLREWISKHARIIAVIGLHQNVFKPHTGTKTSVLILQKWDDKLCPYKEDYPIFFATMQEPSKDSSGEKIYVKYKDFLKWEEEGKIPPLPEDFKEIAKKNPEEKVLDNHGHLIVKHDLFSVQTWHPEVKTPEGIAEAFLEFAKKEGLSFVKKNLTPFNKGKYKRLMDRLEAVELKLSEIREDNPDFRINSEFFRKKYLRNLFLLTSLPHKRLKDLRKTNKRFKQPIYDEGGNLRIVNSQHLRNHFIDFESTRKGFSEEIVPYKAILINSTGVGTLGRVHLNYAEFPFTVDSHITVITTKRELNPYYLMSFLQSQYGQDLINRYYSGSSGQIEIYPKNFDIFPIPLLSPKFQNFIEEVVKTAHQKLEKSKKLYKEAEEILLQELDLKNFRPTNRNYNIVSSKSAFLNGRLDAEYYLPKYEQLIKHLQKFELEPLKEIVVVKKSIEPGSKYYQDSGIPFIRVADFSKYGIDTPKVYLPEDFLTEEEIEKLKPKKGTILLSKDGTVGIAYVVKYPEEEQVITSNAILHLEIKQSKEKEYTPEYIAFVLNSLVGQLQAERDTGGSLIQHWRIEDVGKVLIPKINKDKREALELLLEEVFKLRKESKLLLQKASELVTRAIEMGEDMVFPSLTTI